MAFALTNSDLINITNQASEIRTLDQLAALVATLREQTGVDYSAHTEALPGEVLKHGIYMREKDAARRFDISLSSLRRYRAEGWMFEPDRIQCQRLGYSKVTALAYELLIMASNDRHSSEVAA